MNQLSIIFSFRDRDLQRVTRCLDSLSKQSFSDFEVIFVDYGSKLDLASDVKTLVQSYPFCTYVYSDTRGWPWNRSRALNSGIKLAKADWVMLSDIDLIFEKHVIENIVAERDENTSLHAACHYLPEKFDQWNSLEQYIHTYGSPCYNALGLILCVKKQILENIRGFDEIYHFWGAEDTDLESRLNQLGLQTKWLNLTANPIYHQWHPANNHLAVGFMPNYYWDKVLAYNADNETVLERNTKGWGEIVTTAQRPALEYINASATDILEIKKISNKDYASDNFYRDLVLNLTKLKPGQFLIVKDDFHSPSKANYLIARFINKVLRKLKYNYSLAYKKNAVKDKFFLFLDNHGDDILDFAVIDNNLQEFIFIKK